MIDLPVLSREPSCPAALAIAGACASQQGVVCRLMQADQESDPGLRMSAGALERVREGEGGTYLNLKGDPSTVTAFCHGDALPVLSDAERQGRASYTYCSTWQAARDRHLAGKDGLYEVAEPEPVAHGVEVDPLEDPWVTARRRLDELAPAQPGEMADAFGRRREVDVDARVAEAMRE